MAENNSSAPLKTALPTDVEAFEHFVSDCDGAGIQYDGPSYEQGFLSGKVVGMDAAQAVAAQAAPAAVASPGERAAFALEIRKHCPHASLECHDGQYASPWVQAAWTGFSLRAALTATPALPATEDSSAGDLAKASHQTKLLAQALGDCILASGIVRSDLELSGPQLLMFAEDLKEQLLARQAEVQAEPVSSDPVAWHSKLYGTCWMHKQPYHLDAGTHFFVRGNPNPVATVLSGAAIQWHTGTAAFEHGTFFYTAPQAQPADALDAAADLWYLQDTRSYVGNDVVWWAKDGNGYTTDVSKAHAYTRDYAFRQAAMRGCDRAWPKAYIDGKARPAVDMQYIDHQAAMAAAQEGGKA